MNKKENPQPLVGDCGRREIKGYSSDGIDGSDGEWALTHATGGSEGSQGCREDAHNQLNDGLPSFLFHSIRFLIVIG